jgi:toxin FitB
VSFLLDTNVISEWVRPRPNPGVIAWLADADEDRLFLSVISLAELVRGVERLPAGRSKTRLGRWLSDDLLIRFEGRLLPIDEVVAEGWGRVMARGEAAGRGIGAMDAFLAATAERHGLAIVTRNVADFVASTAAIVNPWSA